jgi:flagellar biosynthesis protein FlhA
MLFQKRGVVVPELEFEIVSERAGVWCGLLVKGVFCYAFTIGADVEPLSCSDRILSVLEQELERRLPELLDDSHTRTLLEINNVVAEDLIHSLIPAELNVTELTRLLRSLVRERVSIRDLPSILQSIAEFRFVNASGSSVSGTMDADSSDRYRDLLAAVRIALSGEITASILREGKIEAFVLSGATEKVLQSQLNSSLPLRPGLIEAIITQLTEVQSQCSVLIVSAHLRKMFADILLYENIEFTVLAPEEISQEMTVHVCGELMLFDEADASIQMEQAA